MTIEFSCPACGRKLRVDDSFAGRRGKCPGCGQATYVPDRETPSRTSSAWMDALADDEEATPPAGPTLSTSHRSSLARPHGASDATKKLALVGGAGLGGVLVVVIALVLLFTRGEERVDPPETPAPVADSSLSDSPLPAVAPQPSAAPQTQAPLADLASYLPVETTLAFGFRPLGQPGSESLSEPLWHFAAAALGRAGIDRRQVSEVVVGCDADGEHVLLAARTFEPLRADAARQGLNATGSAERVAGETLVSLSGDSESSGALAAAFCNDGRTLLLGKAKTLQAALAQASQGHNRIDELLQGRRSSAFFWAVARSPGTLRPFCVGLLPHDLQFGDESLAAARQVRSATMTIRFGPEMHLDLTLTCLNDDSSRDLASVVVQVLDRLMNPADEDAVKASTGRAAPQGQQRGKTQGKDPKLLAGVAVKRDGVTSQISWNLSPTSLAGRFAQRFAASLALGPLTQTAEGPELLPGSLRRVVRSVLEFDRRSGGIPEGAIAQKDTVVIQQISWMAKLLPYLGYRDLYDRIAFSSPWYENENAAIANTVIEAFVNPGAGVLRWKGYPFDGAALTHYVGMAGLGADAPKLSRDDPRAGIFGYDRTLRPEEVKDGASNTILMITAGEIHGPWMQAGGSTVRGARPAYFEGLSGFQAPRGRPGAVAAFADGSVRFLSRDIDPKVFEALCTANGGEPAWETSASENYKAKRSP